MKKMLLLLIFGLSLNVSAQELDDSIYKNAYAGDPYAQAVVAWRLASAGMDEDALAWLRLSISSGYSEACPLVMDILRRNNWGAGVFADLCMIGATPSGQAVEIR